MNYLNRLAWIALSTALVSNAGTALKARKDPILPPSAHLTPFSAWKSIYILRNGVVNPSARKDFNDTLFEYRWKSEWTLNRYVCTVEIRHTEDADDSHTIPEIDILYSDRLSHPLAHTYAAHNVTVGSTTAHAYLKPIDCEEVGLVFWKK
jgi:hypothetical protein